MKAVAIWILSVAWSVPCFSQVPASFEKLKAMQKLPPSIEVATDAAGIFAIYPNSGVPPGSEKWNWAEKTIQVPDGAMARNIVVPTVTVFTPAKEKANGTAVIIAPGGAFNFLMMDKEGHNVARWLSKLGITAFVLKYRVARTPDDNAELQPFLSKLFAVLPRQGPKELDPPVGTLAVEEASFPQIRHSLPSSATSILSRAREATGTPTPAARS